MTALIVAVVAVVAAAVVVVVVVVVAVAVAEDFECRTCHRTYHAPMISMDSKG